MAPRRQEREHGRLGKKKGEGILLAVLANSGFNSKKC